MEIALFSGIGSEDPRYAEAAEYALGMVKKRYSGSLFERFAGAALALPDDELLAGLLRDRYDMYIGFECGEPAGHVAFQRHGGECHMFSIELGEAYQGMGNSLVLSQALIEYARHSRMKIKWSDGNNADALGVLEAIRRRSAELGVEVDDLWITPVP